MAYRVPTAPKAKQPCKVCSNLYAPGGPLIAHERSCEAKQQRRAEALRLQQRGRPQMPPVSIDYPDTFDMGYDPSDDFMLGPADQPEPSSCPSGPMLDDIRVVYHPISERPTEHRPFNEYGKREVKDPEPFDSIPWRPFPSCFDYRVADLVLRCHMNSHQTTTFLRLLDEAHSSALVNMKTYEQVQSMWDAAADRSTQFECAEINVPYSKTIRTYEAYRRPLLGWIREIVQSETLSEHIQWDAQRHYRFNGVRWEQFIHEPWTTDSWWDTQTRINERPTPRRGDEALLKPDAKPLALILYADKDKLSTFGTAKGYPVIATIGNIPADIRNSGGIGGGRIVGWQPVIEEESAHKNKPSWANMKCIVWHQAFLKIIESLILMSQVGEIFKCGDGVTRLIYLVILALSADYEEQCVMCLIRGIKSGYPCPKCMVARDEMSNLSKTWAARTAAETTEVLNEVINLQKKAQQEGLLKDHSLRLAQNTFMLLANSDPFKAVSFDDLHFEDSGLWGGHMFKLLKAHFSRLGRKTETALNRRFDEFPRWRNLNHFNTVTTHAFNDGAKHRDISRMFLFAAESLFLQSDDPAAYQLLKCVQAYLNIIMFGGLHIQTEATMAAGRKNIQLFNSLLDGYALLQFENPSDSLDQKNWEFVKIHYFNHLFDDIQLKGVLHNFSMRLFEKKHGPLWHIYQQRTNFKNIAPQILTIQHQMDVLDLIVAEIQAMEEYNDHVKQLEDPPKDIEKIVSKLGGGHFAIGAKLPVTTFEEFGRTHSPPGGETTFRISLGDFLSVALQANGIELPDKRWIHYKADDEIAAFQFLKINYKSKETWQLATDYLRCNPNFHNRPCYDYIIFDTQGSPVFVQLKYLLVAEVGTEKYPVAYVQSYRLISVGRRT
ncbi:hypothetical protein PQX77_009971 [Marasmius sp. AFHP31]|nr:hypothetical protein PQX77_009971 [Marasmius sp. AFHP31]